jgi:hypothetical protein
MSKAAGIERISAQHDHRTSGNRAVKLVLVFGERFPMIGFQPKRVATDPHAVVTTIARVAQLLAPTAGNALHVELIALEVPFPAGEKFDAAVG